MMFTNKIQVNSKMECKIFLITVFYLFNFVKCDGLTVGGAKCREKVCKVSEFCSSFDFTCQPCKNICDENSHNYEEAICEKDCQNFLHDEKYVLKGPESDDDLRATVNNLTTSVRVNLALVILMFIVLASFLSFQCYRWKVKKNITLESLKAKLFNKQPQNNSSTPTKTNNVTMETKKPDLRIEMPSPTSNSDHSPVTMTTSISRRPAEDSALDYAYDNPAMTKGSR